MRALLLIVAAALILALPAQAVAADPAHSDVIEVGHDATVDRTVGRVVVLGGSLSLGPHARVSEDVIVIFGDLRRSPGARIDGGQYVAGRALVDWIPGPGWVAGVLLALAVLLYRVAVWGAVSAIASTLPRSALYERLSAGWEERPALALGLGLLATAVALPALGLLAITGVGLPAALIGLAALLVACGAGLALFREGPFWPRRLPRPVYAAYLILPPALEVGLLITAAGGLGSALRALSRRSPAPAGE